MSINNNNIPCVGWIRSPAPCTTLTYVLHIFCVTSALPLRRPPVPACSRYIFGIRQINDFLLNPRCSRVAARSTCCTSLSKPGLGCGIRHKLCLALGQSCGLRGGRLLRRFRVEPRPFACRAIMFLPVPGIFIRNRWNCSRKCEQHDDAPGQIVGTYREDPLSGIRGPRISICAGINIGNTYSG